MTVLERWAEQGLRRLGRWLPVAVALPAPLVRASGPWTARELAGRTAFVTRLGDALDLAIARRLGAEGAALVVLDPGPDPAALAVLDERPAAELAGQPRPQVRRRPVAGQDAAALAGALAAELEAGRNGAAPAVLVHRLALPPGAAAGGALAVAPAVEAALERLYAAGHAAARALPRSSRVVLIVAPPAAGAAQDAEHQAAAIACGAAGAFARSLARELGRRGTTVNVLLVRPGALPADVAAAAAFLGSARSAFVSGAQLVLGPRPGGGEAGGRGGHGEEHAGAGGAGGPGPRRLLAGQVAVVTGGARGIGAAIARALAAEGAAVALNDLEDSERAAAAVLEEIRNGGGRAAFVPADIADPAGARALAEAVRAEFGGLDVLVNNAGTTRDRTIAKMDPEGWRQAVRVNLLGQLLTTEALEPLLRDGGRVVNLSSVAGIAGNFGQTNYAAAKAGVIAFTEQLARRLGARGIAVLALAPGYIRTGMTERMPWIHRELARQLTALAQPGEPADVAEVVRFVASAEGAALHGATIRVDGGMAIGR
ncbi:MAG: hypothetical protein KatS3mg102_2357 [Planctomycetota bacterium]|nr:MAG: hypothetical protein KatS3mg102_2357 [Planctomycetota bacterium]